MYVFHYIYLNPYFFSLKNKPNVGATLRAFILEPGMVKNMVKKTLTNTDFPFLALVFPFFFPFTLHFPYSPALITFLLYSSQLSVLLYYVLCIGPYKICESSLYVFVTFLSIIKQIFPFNDRKTRKSATFPAPCRLKNQRDEPVTWFHDRYSI